MMLAAYLAVIRAGGIAVGTMPLLRSSELIEILVKARISHALCDERLREELEKAAPKAPDLEQTGYFNGAATAELEKRMAGKPTEFTPYDSASDDVCLIAFTSGTTGKPKGIVHSTAGYLLGTYATFKWIFDIKENDTYWCTADIGWVTGHSYIVYGPLANGATSVMYEGSPDYPDRDRFWDVVEKYGVTILYLSLIHI